ncbi:MAG TPA: hypothetical protein VHI13_04815 [Candidatus Kapabacteria bacterium]|nr:hypothetical protein [Candidatus Kapabacteria bacterium]
MHSLYAESRKYWAVFRIELRQQTTYFWDFVLGNAVIVLFLFVLIQVWQATVKPENVAGLRGEHLNWAELIWFLAAAQTLYFAVHTEAQIEIEHDVVSGNIAVVLARPYDYLMLRFATSMAHTVLSLAVALPAAVAIAWIVSGTVAVTPLGAVAFLLAFVMRTALFLALQAIAGLATFWVEKATAFVWILNLLIITFGGGAVPIGFWPSWARTLVELTPFPTMMYYPAMLLVRPEPALIGATLLRAAVWTVVLGGGTAFIYSRALRRLDVNGG